MQPGAARFTIPAPTRTDDGTTAPDIGEGGQNTAEVSGADNGDAIAATAAGGDAAPSSIVAALNHKELAKSQVPTLEVGDVVEADLWRSKLGGGRVSRCYPYQFIQ